MKNDMISNTETIINKIFGDFRAEWLGDSLYPLYLRPSYFGQLTTSKPIILSGGRGTGKTTNLIAMSYEGRHAIERSSSEEIQKWDNLALYIRVESGRVGSFKGSGKATEFWQPIFAHYWNLVMCLHLLDMVEWCNTYARLNYVLSADSLQVICSALLIEQCNDLTEIRTRLILSMINFETKLQSALSGNPVELTLLGSPVETILHELKKHIFFKEKTILFLIDEFENFSEYQQQCMNTLLKHSGKMYSVKIGMRPYGWKTRYTITGEKLVAPADYAVVELDSQTDFAEFAETVCNNRLSFIAKESDQSIVNVKSLFPGISSENEFQLLGGQAEIKNFRSKSKLPQKLLSAFSDIELNIMVAFERPDTYKRYLETLKNDEDARRDRVNNYSYASLFYLGKKRKTLRKYYCGWDSFLLLASGNLRFLLLLVQGSLLKHLESNGKFGEAISPENQTIVAQSVGERAFLELRDESQRGVEISRFVLGLGVIFQSFAASPMGHSPELNQFIRHRDGRLPNVDDILEEACRHLGVIRLNTTKTLKGQIRDFDYTLHPVMSPFFCYSHRRKRKMVISDKELLNIASEDGGYLGFLKSRKELSRLELPAQLSLYNVEDNNE